MVLTSEVYPCPPISFQVCYFCQISRFFIFSVLDILFIPAVWCFHDVPRVTYIYIYIILYLKCQVLLSLFAAIENHMWYPVFYYTVLLPRNDKYPSAIMLAMQNRHRLLNLTSTECIVYNYQLNTFKSIKHNNCPNVRTKEIYKFKTKMLDSKIKNSSKRSLESWAHGTQMKLFSPYFMHRIRNIEHEPFQRDSFGTKRAVNPLVQNISLPESLSTLQTQLITAVSSTFLRVYCRLICQRNHRSLL